MLAVESGMTADKDEMGERLGWHVRRRRNTADVILYKGQCKKTEVSRQACCDPPDCKAELVRVKRTTVLICRPVAQGLPRGCCTTASMQSSAVGHVVFHTRHMRPGSGEDSFLQVRLSCCHGHEAAQEAQRVLGRSQALAPIKYRSGIRYTERPLLVQSGEVGAHEMGERHVIRQQC